MKNESGPRDTGHTITSETNISNGQEKWRRILALLITGKKLTRFDVEPYGDHCFNTSVSVIGKKGIAISREAIVIEGKFGVFRCKRYWLESEEIERAGRLLTVRS
jgi:hypothetical protein